MTQGAVRFFSIVTVNYNDLPGLILTANSVFLQSFTEFDWIVVDGKSSDGSIKFLQNFDRVDLTWLSEKDAGIYDAMNKGIARARGKFVVFMNAGDVFPHADVLKNVHDYLTEIASEPDIILGGATLVLPSGGWSYRPPKEMGRYIWHGLPANHQATYFRRDRLEKVRYDLTYRICGDYYLMAKLYTQGAHAVYLDQPLVDFRVGDTSYRNPFLLFREPYLIQRDILRLSVFTRGRSLLKRLISTVGVILLSQRWAKRFVS